MIGCLLTSETIFFYGLFMDPDLLQEQGYNPSQPTIARLDNFQLHIGKRATLKPSNSEQVYGTLMRLSNQELDTLYAQPSVRDYHPVQVTCEIGEDDFVEAKTYILPAEAPLTPAMNADYAQQLLIICKKMNLPSLYQQKINEMIHKLDSQTQNL